MKYFVLSRKGHDEARRLLREHRQQLDALAQALLQNETLNEKEIFQVTGLCRKRTIDNRDGHERIAEFLIAEQKIFIPV